MPEPENDLDQLIRQVQNLEKYRAISPELIRSLLIKELAKRGTPKQAVKTTRNKLHQVGTVYQEKVCPYVDWLDEMALLPADLNNPVVLSFLQRVMPAHSSTRERMNILPRFYKECLSELGEINSVLDIACGLNPLAIPWMPLHPGFTYTACDIFSDMLNFLSAFFSNFSIDGKVLLCDVTREIPPVTADLTLVLKTIPCLEQLDKDAGQRLLSGLTSPNILVSYPAKSLGGRSKGMVQHYEQHFDDLVSGKPWQITRFEFPGELAFLVQK